MKVRSIAQILQILSVDFETEYRFHPTRYWRFDYAIPEKKIAFEYEGIYGKGKSRHTNVKGYKKDCDKYNEAQILGWTVIRFTSDHLNDGSAFEVTEIIVELK